MDSTQAMSPPQTQEDAAAPPRNDQGYKNVGSTERWASLAGGALLTLYGLGRRVPSNLVFTGLGVGLLYRGLTGHCSVYQVLGHSTRETEGPEASIAAGRGVRVEHSLTVNRAPEELYRFWRNFENLPKFMRHLDRVEVHEGGRSHWTAKGPLGTTVAWEAEIVTDTPPSTIAWRSLNDSQVDCAGSVHFRPGPRGEGCELRVNLRYDAPLAQVGSALVKLFGQAPEQFIKEDLRRFKQLMETGEIATVENQPRGTCHMGTESRS